VIGSFGQAFCLLKGNSLFNLETTYGPGTRMHGGDIVRKMISHLQSDHPGQPRSL
jgi:hypothetical protein